VPLLLPLLLSLCWACRPLDVLLLSVLPERLLRHLPDPLLLLLIPQVLLPLLQVG
jgi:hypothetical protein